MRESKLDGDKYILNPKTGRYVKKTGAIGKLLVAKTYAGAVGEDGEPVEPPKRGRWRPRKNFDHLVPKEPTEPKRGRGRPRKNPEQLVKPPSAKKEALIRKSAGNLIAASIKRKIAQGDGAKMVESANLIKKAVRRRLIENQVDKETGAGNLIVAMAKRNFTQRENAANTITKTIRKKLAQNQKNKEIAAGNVINAVLKRKLNVRPKPTRNQILSRLATPKYQAAPVPPRAPFVSRYKAAPARAPFVSRFAKK